MILLLIIISFATGIYFLNQNYQYWKKRGVPGPKPKFFVGNIADNILVKKSPGQVYEDIYNQFPDASLVGIFRATTPALILRDPDLIKDITVKSFSHFHDNELCLDKNVDPLLGRNPFFAKGDDWKNYRVLLTPGFTSGKMKFVYPLLEDISRQLIKYIDRKKQEGPLKGKEMCMRFTLNNVGSCAFGLDAKCFDEENSEFKQIADRFVVPDGWQAIKILLITTIPVLAKLVSIKFTPTEVEEKLVNIITQTLQYRERNNVVRNDFLEILNQIKKKDPSFTELDVTAHATSFFLDGYETSSIVMHLVLYELAANAETQRKLREEINIAFEENNGELPYEELQKMTYLDAVYNESLRLHPPLGSLNKVCTKDYTYNPKEIDVITKPFVIEAGTLVMLPLYGLHRDPKYFEDPLSFKPERFLKESKENIKSYSFMPFGEGPRACIGKRFGTMQVKVGVAYIVKHFEISISEKTKLPLKYDPMFFLTLPKDPIWFDFKKIS